MPLHTLSWSSWSALKVCESPPGHVIVMVPSPVSLFSSTALFDTFVSVAVLVARSNANVMQGVLERRRWEDRELARELLMHVHPKITLEHEGESRPACV